MTDIIAHEEKTFQEIIDGEDGLKKTVACMVVDYANPRSGNTWARDMTLWVSDLLRYGCVSGMVSELIYYTDTVAFHDEHEVEIWDMLWDTSRELGDDNILELIASFNGSKDVGSMDQFKNLLAWWAFEETARQIAYECELEV